MTISTEIMLKLRVKMIDHRILHFYLDFIIQLILNGKVYEIDKDWVHFDLKFGLNSTFGSVLKSS